MKSIPPNLPELLTPETPILKYRDVLVKTTLCRVLNEISSLSSGDTINLMNLAFKSRAKLQQHPETISDCHAHIDTLVALVIELQTALVPVSALVENIQAYLSGERQNSGAYPEINENTRLLFNELESRYMGYAAALITKNILNKTTLDVLSRFGDKNNIAED